MTAAERTIDTMKSTTAKLEKQLVCSSLPFCLLIYYLHFLTHACLPDTTQSNDGMSRVPFTKRRGARREVSNNTLSRKVQNSSVQILRICTETRDGDRPTQEWRRASGQPPTTWIRQICRDMGVTATEALQLGQTVLANNRNGGRLRLIASRHYYYYYYSASVEYNRPLVGGLSVDIACICKNLFTNEYSLISTTWNKVFNIFTVTD